MIDLPLFPLNAVLFPGIPFQLNIFETRYQVMISECLENQQPFGVVLIKKGLEALGPLADPHSVGCTAQIIDVERLEQGRSNITVIGLERFMIHSLSYDKPYLVGRVEMVPFQVDDPAGLRILGDRLRPLVGRYLNLLARPGSGGAAYKRLPQNPLKLACLAAYLLQVPLRQKQGLLSEEKANAFLANLTGLFPREIVILEKLLEEPGRESDGVFSAN